MCVGDGMVDGGVVFLSLGSWEGRFADLWKWCGGKLNNKSNIGVVEQVCCGLSCAEGNSGWSKHPPFQGQIAEEDKGFVSLDLGGKNMEKIAGTRNCRLITV